MNRDHDPRREGAVLPNFIVLDLLKLLRIHFQFLLLPLLRILHSFQIVLIDLPQQLLIFLIRLVVHFLIPFLVHRFVWNLVALRGLV